MMRGYAAHIGACAMALVATGCGLSGEVTDFSRKTTEMRKISHAPTKELKIIDGDAKIVIDLKDIEKLVLLPAEARTVNNELYYMAEITLRDGTEIGVETRERKRVKAFVCISGTLSGKAKGGTFEIRMSDVSELLLVGQ